LVVYRQLTMNAVMPLGRSVGGLAFGSLRLVTGSMQEAGTCDIGSCDDM
jgi:hypothetical protein